MKSDISFIAFLFFFFLVFLPFLIFYFFTFFLFYFFYFLVFLAFFFLVFYFFTFFLFSVFLFFFIVQRHYEIHIAEPLFFFKLRSGRHWWPYPSQNPKHNHHRYHFQSWYVLTLAIQVDFHLLNKRNTDAAATNILGILSFMFKGSNDLYNVYWSSLRRP